jgi:hypothetical protein
VTVGHSTVEEPVLTISRPPPYWGWRSPFTWVFTVAMCLVLVGGVMVLKPVFYPPPEPVTLLRGIMASKQDFFNDAKVQQLLLDHGFRVEVTARGSREVAMEVLGKGANSYDFAFPSGQPAADLIKRERSATGLYERVTTLFSSPMILATYREYAQTLDAFGVASPQREANPLYYTLQTDKFMALGTQHKTWNHLGISTHGNGLENGNQVLAQTSGVCRSNSGATYLGLLAFVANGRVPAQTEADVDRLVTAVRPLISGTGLPEADLFETYLTPEGKSRAPIVVVYEHQFLRYQLDHQRSTGQPDYGRVLLYPLEEFQTDPEFIALKPGPAGRLAELLATDTALRRRMMELGFRVQDPTDKVSSRQLFRYLDQHGLPIPGQVDITQAQFPKTLDLLERLIGAVGDCPP